MSSHGANKKRGDACESGDFFHDWEWLQSFSINRLLRPDIYSDSIKQTGNSVKQAQHPLTQGKNLFSLRPVKESLKQRLHAGLSFWRLNVIVWSLFAVFSLIERLAIFPTIFQASVFSIFQIPIAAILSSLLRIVYRMPFVGTTFRIATAAWIIGLSLVAACIHAYIIHEAAHSLGWINSNINADVAFGLRIKFYWLVYMAWGLGYFWIRAQIEASSQAEQAKEARAEAHRIELQMLRAQLDPHFLFNSLNSVTAEIRPHPDTAISMMRELCDYLRYSLDHRNQPTGELASELDAVSAYLKIQRARFGDRLNTRIEADDASRHRIVPSFLLQPLVENAVKHGFEAEHASWDLSLKARIAYNTLLIDVKNSGHLNPSESGHQGVGLSTLRRRLELHYPRRHSFEMTEENGFVYAKLKLIGNPCFA